MVWEIDHSTAAGIWELVRRQHGVVAGWQLREAGLSRRGIEHRIAKGRLRRVGMGVYAVGRPELTQRGHWMAAVLPCGPRAVARLRQLLDRRTFRLTDSELERWFLPEVRRAGLPLPLTRQHLNGFKGDFFWPDLLLVVETDGLRYHRTPAQQARDRVRDQAHLAAGFIPLRFTHWQVRYERQHVRSTLLAVVHRIEARRSP